MDHAHEIHVERLVPRAQRADRPENDQRENESRGQSVRLDELAMPDD